MQQLWAQQVMTGLLFPCHLGTVVQDAKHRAGQHWQTKGKVCQEGKTSRDVLWWLLNDRAEGILRISKSAIRFHNESFKWMCAMSCWCCILLELWQCRRIPTWLCREYCAHAHSSSQRKTSPCPLQPKAGRRQNVMHHIAVSANWSLFIGSVELTHFTLTRSLGHPVPNTLRLPYPRVFPPYSVTFRLLVLGPA